MVDEEHFGRTKRTAMKLLQGRVSQESLPCRTSAQVGRQMSKSLINGQQAKRKRAGCGYNAFQKARMAGQRLKVGCPEHKQRQKQLSEEWAQMSAEEKAVFSTQAHSENGQKHDVSSQTLDKDVAAEQLSYSQKKRLGQRRLDASLRAIACHPAWSHGLQLANHISALKPELVKDLQGANAARVEIKDAFSYDERFLDINLRYYYYSALKFY